ncbi:hypothetical protein Scep_004102 [Stephania cephalantha]|uniref:Myb/SANT-like domain-containing protein n=1 Tax=Stephania cephalantha TaxID=152367 RepID=A0AAP0KRT3_9MAGN
MDFSNSQLEVYDRGGKGKQLRWTFAMDVCLIETFLEQARLGYRGKKGFKDEAYKAVINAVAERLNVDISQKHIDHRLKSFRNEYRMFTILRQQNGFVWDAAQNKVIAPDNVWNDYIKAHPKFKGFRGRACKWDFDSLIIILGKDDSTENLDMEDTASWDLQQQTEDTSKVKQLRWSQVMDDCMIRILVEQSRMGLKGEKGFKDEAYSTVSNALANQLGVDVSRNHIDNRLKTIRIEYQMFHALREQNEFSWDPIKNKVVAPDAIWNDFLKAHPKFNSYRGRACKWDYESLDIILGNNDAMECYALRCFDSSESQVEVENKVKGRQLRWTREMDDFMLQTLAEQVRLGNKGDKGFKDQAYDAVVKALANEIDVEVCGKHIENRLKTIRTEYNMFITLREQSGFVWDSSKAMIVAPDDLWNDFIKAHPKFKSYRGRACRWNFMLLDVIMGNDTVHGNVSMNSVDGEMSSGPTEGEEFCDVLPLAEENISECGTDEEMGRLMECIKTNSSSLSKNGHCYKKPRTADIVREVIDLVKAKVSGVAKSSDGLSFAKKLYTEVMKVEGFSPDFLDRAFEILKRDEHGAEIFLVRTEPYRKRMLEEMYQKYGDKGISNEQHM